MIMFILNTVGESARLLGNIVACGSGYLIRRRSNPDINTLRARVFKDFLLRMGPLYIKMGQVLATQSGLFASKAVNEFRHFFSKLPPQSERKTKRTIEAAYGQHYRDYFTVFEWQPIAVGSVAQVHRARLADGRDVAVKILKKGVRQRIEAGSVLFDCLLRIGHRLSRTLRPFDLPKHFAELRPLLLEQCNLTHELENLEAVRRNFLGYPNVRVPVPDRRLSSNDILVMEFMEGREGAEYSGSAQERAATAERLQDVFYTMTYFHGLFHLDPHPGNFLIDADGCVVLLDFGLVGNITEEDKWSLAGFHYACLRHDWHEAVNRFISAFAELGVNSTVRSDVFRESFKTVLVHHFVTEVSKWSTVSFLDDANKLLRAHAARLSTRFSLIAISMLTGEGVLCLIDPSIDVWRNARRFMDKYSPYVNADVKKRFDTYFGGAIPKSIRRRAEAAQYLLAPVHFDRYVFPSPYPIVVSEARGAILKDIDGRSYVDFSCGYGPHILGYAHPIVIEAISTAVTRGAVNAIGNEYELELAKAITDALPAADKVLFCNSGTEAGMTAMRLARTFTGRKRIAKCEGHYHGFSDQGMVSSYFKFRGHKENPKPAGCPGSQASVVDETLVLQYGSTLSLEVLQLHSRDIAAVIVEPLPTSLGRVHDDFLRQLRELCTKEGIVLIFDEVITGFRVAYGGVQNVVGIDPDLTCLAKVIGGGLPCGAIAGRREIIDAARTTGDPFKDLETKTFAGGTLSGNSMSCAAGLAVLRYLKDNPQELSKLHTNTDYLVTRLNAVASALNVKARIGGYRSIMSLTFDHGQPRYARDRISGSNYKANLAFAYYMRKHGVYTPEFHTLMLSTAHTEADLESIVNAYHLTLSEMLADDVLARSPTVHSATVGQHQGLRHSTLGPQEVASPREGPAAVPDQQLAQPG